ncbi:MAG: endonuclease I family protein [Planctomycetota bacterium]
MRCPSAFASAMTLATAAAYAQPPASYYATVDASSPSALRQTLHAVIDDHMRFPYTSGGTDTWDILDMADEDPNNASRILDVYRNASFGKAGGGNSNYNREHTWPNSYGFPNDGGGNYPYTDCHHLFLCETSYNGLRDRRPFDSGNAGWNELTTFPQPGRGGGGSGVYPGFSNWRTTNNSPGGFEIWSERRGDVARALLYMDVRYEGGTHGGTGASEPDLILTDNLSLVTQSATGNNESTAYMGKLSVLLQWHQQDPVDQLERDRNDIVYLWQGNRNPFVDQPNWVDCLYQGQCGPQPGGAREPEVWINELHYDNVGTDVGEFVELAGRADECIDGWLLIAYDGATGTAYDFRVLRHTFGNQQNGFGTHSVLFPGLQNGTDGLALVTGSGAVLQLLSYEGTFQAQDGAAAGLTSTDIGQSETSTTPTGRSLRLSGTASSYSQFTWQPPFFASPGLVNSTQLFQ